MRGVPFHVYYMQFGQYTHPTGSGRPHGQLASLKIAEESDPEIYISGPWLVGRFVSFSLRCNETFFGPQHLNPITLWEKCL